jgi:uncharacterized protein
MFRFFWLLIALLISSSAQAAHFCSNRHLSKIEAQICSNEQLKRLDEALNNNYQKTLTAVTDKQSIMRQQRHWLHAVRNKCPDEDCLRLRYDERIGKLSEIFVRSLRVSEQAITGDKETEKLCQSMAKLADNQRLTKLAILGRNYWEQHDKEAIKAGWGLTEAEKTIVSQHIYYGYINGSGSYKLRLQQKKPLVRFIQTYSSGTCPTYELVNNSFLLDKKNIYEDHIGKEKVYDPKDEIRWAYMGGSEYPIFYQGRNFVVTADLRDENQAEMISWIKPDGKIRPMCLLKVQKVQKLVISAKNKQLRNAVAKGTITPLAWQSIREKLPFEYDPKTFDDEFTKRYGKFAHSVELLNIDINMDGVSENIGRFVYESGAGCGSTSIWLSILTNDFGGLVKGSLNDLLGHFTEQTNALNKTNMDIYKYHDRYYMEASKNNNYGLYQIKNNKIKQVCKFGEKNQTGIKRLF